MVGLPSSETPFARPCNPSFRFQWRKGRSISRSVREHSSRTLGLSLSGRLICPRCCHKHPSSLSFRPRRRSNNNLFCEFPTLVVVIWSREAIRLSTSRCQNDDWRQPPANYVSVHGSRLQRQAVMAALRSRCWHYIYSARSYSFSPVLDSLCGSFQRCSRVRL